MRRDGNIIYMSGWIVIQPEMRSETEIPESLVRDDEIRTQMETTLSRSEIEIIETTKMIYENGLLPLLETIVEWPFVLPSVHSHGTDNESLKLFAYDAYDALSAHFKESSWDNWYITTYFNQEGDTRKTLGLAVFIGQNFNKTVVE